MGGDNINTGTTAQVGAPDDQTILSVQDITKDFPGLRALDQVSMQVRSGEILALLGQNGSGKSTLVKILAGLYAPDSGSVTTHRSGGDAHDVLHFIHQDLGLIDTLSTVENLAIGRHRNGHLLRPLHHRVEQDHARQLVHRFGAHFDVCSPLSRLTPAQRTIVAIARAMDGWTDPRSVLVLDEPTAALHGEEVGVLFTAVRQAARAGAAIIFISHRLDEVVELAHRVIVLRDGRLVADAATSGLSVDSLAALIIGRDLTVRQADSGQVRSRAGSPVLAVRGLASEAVQPLDLDIWAGEIVGISGNLGSGREDVAGLIFGSVARSAGTITVADKCFRRSSPLRSIKAGMALVPANRHTHGAVMAHDVVENLTLPDLKSVSHGGIHLRRRVEFAEAARWAEQVGVVPNLPRRPLRLFSGGNQQKVVIARWLRIKPTVLLVEEPTQGVDVGSSESIRELVVDASRNGAAVLVASSDNADLIRMCTRVLVFRDGMCTAELSGESLTDHRLTEECLGVSPRALAFDNPAPMEEVHG